MGKIFGKAKILYFNLKQKSRLNYNRDFCFNVKVKLEILENSVTNPRQTIRLNSVIKILPIAPGTVYATQFSTYAPPAALCADKNMLEGIAV